MANNCCEIIECNESINLGYIKGIINSVTLDECSSYTVPTYPLDSCCLPNNHSDSGYTPSYAQLRDNFVHWNTSTMTDGIDVPTATTGGSCCTGRPTVKKSDFQFKYYKFVSFTVSGSSTLTCTSSSNAGFEYKYSFNTIGGCPVTSSSAVTTYNLSNPPANYSTIIDAVALTNSPNEPSSSSWTAFTSWSSSNIGNITVTNTNMFIPSESYTYVFPSGDACTGSDTVNNEIAYFHIAKFRTSNCLKPRGYYQITFSGGTYDVSNNLPQNGQIPITGGTYTLGISTTGLFGHNGYYLTLNGGGDWARISGNELIINSNACTESNPSTSTRSGDITIRVYYCDENTSFKDFKCDFSQAGETCVTPSIIPCCGGIAGKSSEYCC